MVNKEQIEQWLREGTITEEQARKMLADSSEHGKEQSSNKFVVAISTIGSILLGLGAILFVASNWLAMSNVVKIFVLLGSTFGAYGIGYFLKYHKKNLPKVGGSLIFLGALLFGATIFLIAQMYNVNANSHALVLLWLVGILPFVYAFQSSAIAGLSAILFYLWIGLFVFKGLDFYQAEGDFFRLPVLFLVSGVLLFGVGQLHYIAESLRGVARIYRLAGVKVAMTSLFFLTFNFFSGHYGDYGILPGSIETSAQFTYGFVFFSVMALLLGVVGLFFNPSKSSTNNLENSSALGLVAIALLFFFFPTTTNIYVIIFNLLLAGIVFALLFVGYQREDMQIVNIGTSWLSLLILSRYFDFFWGLLPSSIFFMVGGLILVLGGIALENKKKQLKAKFSNQIAV